MQFTRTILRMFAAAAACLFLALPVAASEDQKPQVVRDVEYCKRGEHSLKCDLYLPPGDGPFPGVLLVHGGAWMLGSKSQMTVMALELAERGFVAMSINYRLAPRFQFPAQIDDCKTAVRWMRTNAARHKVDPDRIGGLGYSAGGQLVALLGTTDPSCGLEGTDDDSGTSTRLQCVVAGGAPCDFRVLPQNNTTLAYWLGGSRREKPEAYALASPATFISKDDPPMLFYHGEKDGLVPVSSPQAMLKLLTEAGVAATIYLVHDAGHVGAFHDRRASAEAIKFLDKQLKPAN